MIKKTAKSIKRIKNHFSEIFHPHYHPHEIALGFGIGSFISILPTPGFSVILGLIAISIFSKLNKIALFSAFLLFNPFMLMPLYTLSYQIGDFIFWDIPVLKFKFEILNQLYTYSRRFLIGNIIVSTTVAIVSYWVFRFIFFMRKLKIS